MTDPSPLGAVVPHWAPRPRPARAPIVGRHVRLEPLDAARHGAALWTAIAGHDALWSYLADGPFADEATFRDWLARHAAGDDPLAFAIVETRDDRAVVGTLSLMSIRPEAGVIEVGHVLFAPALQRSAAATEAIVLAAATAFDTLGYRRFEWKCNALNAPSRRAALRYGFMFEGVFRQHMVVKGRNRDTAWFAMLDSDWPRCRAAFEAWLDPANFDAAGRQRRGLASFRDSVAQSP